MKWSIIGFFIVFIVEVRGIVIDSIEFYYKIWLYVFVEKIRDFYLVFGEKDELKVSFSLRVS